jgi:CRISPR-associated exonuclease Cas4
MNVLFVLAALLGLIALTILWRASRARAARGFSPGHTVALDDKVLFSKRLMLVGRPDRIVEHGGRLIPEEWKSGRRVYPGHRLQLGVYFLLIEDLSGTRPTHGFVVLGDGSRVRFENTESLRAEVEDSVDQIRSHRTALERPIPVHQSPSKCRSCGQRPHCGQASG